MFVFLPTKDKKKRRSEYKNDEEYEANLKLEKEFKDRIAVLTIAYHNLGVEQEFLKRYYDAVESYRMAMDFATRYLGSQDKVTRSMKQIYERAQQ